MNWTAFATTLPVVGQGFGPSDLILMLWPATPSLGPVVDLVSTAAALGTVSIMNPGGGAPQYWASLPPMPVAPAAVVTPAAQIAALQAVIAALPPGANNPALTAALATVQAAVPVTPPTP